MSERRKERTQNETITARRRSKNSNKLMQVSDRSRNGESSENVQSKSSVQINEQQKKEVKRSLLHAMPMSFQGGFKSSKQGSKTISSQVTC